MRTRLKIGGALSLLGVMVVAIIGPFEGLRLVAYRDVVGVPTICYGETRGVEIGDRYTAEECAQMLGDAVVEFEREMRSCLDEPDKIPDRVYVAFLSLAYNIGGSAFCRSTLVRLANEGDLRAACDQIPRWNRAGGRVIKGLVNRRAEEHRICLAGLNDPVSLRAAPQAKPKPAPSAPADVPASATDAVQEVSPWLFWIVSAVVALLIVGLLVALVRRRRE